MNTNGTFPKHESTTNSYIMKMFLYRQLWKITVKYKYVHLENKIIC